MAEEVDAMLWFKSQGAEVFDYGNNIRACAQDAGCERAFEIPGFVPAYIRPLFCVGQGALPLGRAHRRSRRHRRDRRGRARGRARRSRSAHVDRARTRACRLPGAAVADLLARLRRSGQVGLAFNELVRIGKVKAPIVIGRDHLDCGSVASPNRETEAMKDGSDAIADWPMLNALVNTAAGASWVSFHHGGGVGIGMSLHAGMVVVADGTPEAARRLERVLTTDPGMGVIRHADAGYDEARTFAKEHGLHLP